MLLSEFVLIDLIRELVRDKNSLSPIFRGGKISPATRARMRRIKIYIHLGSGRKWIKAMYERKNARDAISVVGERYR